MKRWRLVVAGSACYLLALVAMAPAALLDPLLQRASAQRLRLADAHGTVWSGRAVLLLAERADQRALTWPLRWHWLPGALLQGMLAIQVETASSGTPAIVALHFDRVEMRNMEIDAPVAVLGGWLPALAPFQLGGTLRLNIDQLVWRVDDLSAQAVLRWRDASTPYASIAPLGEYLFSFGIKRRFVKVDLQTLSGPLRAEGHGTWRAGAAPKFQAFAQVSPQQRLLLEPLLQKIEAAFSAENFSWNFK